MNPPLSKACVAHALGAAFFAASARRPPPIISHRQIDRHALALGEAVEHALERELVADAALLVATVGHAGHLAAALVDLYPARFDCGPRLYARVQSCRAALLANWGQWASLKLATLRAESGLR